MTEAAPRKDYKLNAVRGTLALTGRVTGLRATRRMTAQCGTFLLTGFSTVLKYGYGYRLLMASCAVALTDTPVLFARTTAYRLVIEIGVFVRVAESSALLIARVLSAETGSLIVAGQVAELVYEPYRLPPPGILRFGIKVPLLPNRW